MWGLQASGGKDVTQGGACQSEFTKGAPSATSGLLAALAASMLAPKALTSSCSLSAMSGSDSSAYLHIGCPAWSEQSVCGLSAHLWDVHVVMCMPPMAVIS